MLVTPNKVEQGTSRDILQILQVKKAICSGYTQYGRAITNGGVRTCGAAAVRYRTILRVLVYTCFHHRISLHVTCSTLFGGAVVI